MMIRGTNIFVRAFLIKCSLLRYIEHKNKKLEKIVKVD